MAFRQTTPVTSHLTDLPNRYLPKPWSPVSPGLTDNPRVRHARRREGPTLKADGHCAYKRFQICTRPAIEVASCTGAATREEKLSETTQTLSTFSSPTLLHQMLSNKNPQYPEPSLAIITMSEGGPDAEANCQAVRASAALKVDSLESGLALTIERSNRLAISLSANFVKNVARRNGTSMHWENIEQGTQVQSVSVEAQRGLEVLAGKRACLG